MRLDPSFVRFEQQAFLVIRLMSIQRKERIEVVVRVAELIEGEFSCDTFANQRVMTIERAEKIGF